MSNLGLEHALRELGIGFLRAKVGDRYVLELLREKGGGWAARPPGTCFAWTRPRRAMV
jgi:phosphoglucosamine mutase